MVENQNLEELVKEKGWKKTVIGQFRSSGQIKEINSYTLYVRETPFGDFLKKTPFQTPLKQAENSINTGFFDRGSITSMGNPYNELTPEDLPSESPAGLPELADFKKFPCLMAARPNKPCILIGYDSEWQTLSRDRNMLSWQFAVVWYNKLIEFCFLKNECEYNLSLSMALGCILDYIGVESVDVRKITRYKYCTGWSDNKPVTVITDDLQEAKENCVYTYKNGGFTRDLVVEQPDKYENRSNRDWSWFHRYLDYDIVGSVRVTLVCHAGIGDLSGLSYEDKELFRYLTPVQGGLINLYPTKIVVRSLKNVNHLSLYPISLTVSDTMCHAPANGKSLEHLGAVLGIPKYDLPVETKEHMQDLLVKDPVTFLEYASTDSVITLLYASALYGYNNTPPATITSASARVIKNAMMSYFGCDNSVLFNMVYRGLKKVSHGLVQRDHSPGYVESSSLEPISDKVSIVQNYATQSFHGGYNICCEVGAFLRETHDFDLKNAYPTVMCLVPDINWSDPIRRQVQKEYLDINLWCGNPIIPFFGYVKFEFPEDVLYPCIPVNVDGVPVYPRTSDGLDGVYVAGPYLYLALKLGAKVWCENGYFLNTLVTVDGRESHSLAVGIKQLVVDRDLAKKICGRGSLVELILKVMGSSTYGKTAQNVIDKTTWSAYANGMVDLGCSAITNPVSATMTTSIVQCLLIAAMNQLHDLGYMTCSGTTDGFISNCSLAVLQKLDLYGFKTPVEKSRVYLSGSPELWECKHAQDDLVNFTTRGNVSLHYYDKDDHGDPVYNADGSVKGNPMILNGKAYDGVCAHNSTKSGFVSDSYEDRLWLMTQVLSRTGTIKYIHDEWTKFKDIVNGSPFFSEKKTEHVHMDFDMKRKPDRNSFCTDYVTIDGVVYEIAHFKTVPFENVEEFLLYRKKKGDISVLRTIADWDVFWTLIDCNGSRVHIYEDKERSIIMSCIMGYRMGRWDIPALKDKTVEEKCEWINGHHNSKKKFTPSDWKNCRRPERQARMLPVEMIQSKLDELINAEE